MPDIKEKDGVVILESSDFDMKIDKSRKIYVKRKDQNNFSYTGHDTPEGMSSIEKKKVLYDIYRHIQSKIKQ